MARRGALTGNVGREPDVRNLARGVAQTGSMEHPYLRNTFLLREPFHKRTRSLCGQSLTDELPVCDEVSGTP